MVIYNKGGNTWKELVTHLLHQPDWKDKSIEIADVTKAILQTKTFGHTAQASSEKRRFIFFAEGEVEVCEAREVHVVVHVAVEVVLRKAVVLPPISSQRSARKRLSIVRSALLNIVSVTRVSKPFRRVNKKRQIMVISVQMLQLKFAISLAAKTRRNVLRRLPDGVMQQQKHMRAR
jgi:hypothetical protein